LPILYSNPTAESVSLLTRASFGNAAESIIALRHQISIQNHPTATTPSCFCARLLYSAPRRCGAFVSKNKNEEPTMSFANLKVGTRLAAGFGVLVLLLAGTTILGVSRLNGLYAGTDAIANDRYPRVANAYHIQDGLTKTSVILHQLLIVEDPEQIKQMMADIDAIRTDVTSRFEQLKQQMQTDRARQRYNEMLDARVAYRTDQAAFLKLVAEDKKPEAARLLGGAIAKDQKVYFDKVKGIIDLGEAFMQDATRTAEDQYRSGTIYMLSLAAAAIVLACALAYWVTRSITGPLQAAVRIARTVASGDLTSRIEVLSTDETGQLLQELKDMNLSLVRVVGDVRQRSDTIATASSQIASGNLDLSSRTEQQASSLQQTAAAMEQLTATVRQSADNARQANQLVLSASASAGKGGAVVSQVVDTMQEINVSALKIVDIIAVIDSIAFQTNILALNAAVEAARAGEQGRGFAVVASEVRNLAQRSAAAAREIKILIDDSVHKVDSGSQLVTQAGITMDEIVAGVQRVTDIMGEIASASVEQETGIGQINQAISEMDAVTQQNAALVEQAAAAAAALQQQAHGLTQVVSVFRLDQTPLTLT
jgi:methyl-accepting chemotaxis protein